MSGVRPAWSLCSSSAARGEHAGARVCDIHRLDAETSQLLRRLVPVIRGCLREEELLARIGGDEFAVLIENCGADYALEAGTRIRDAVQAWQFEWGEHAFQVGVSAGVVAITRLTPPPAWPRARWQRPTRLRVRRHGGAVWRPRRAPHSARWPLRLKRSEVAPASASATACATLLTGLPPTASMRSPGFRNPSRAAGAAPLISTTTTPASGRPMPSHCVRTASAACSCCG
jgi:hypothetical protein